jgi:hypothetical protein
MLEGNEVEGKIGDMGEYAVDADTKGGLTISAAVKKDWNGHTRLQNTLLVKTNIIALAKEVAKKTTGTELDDKGVAGIQAILGIKDEELLLPPDAV